MTTETSEVKTFDYSKYQISNSVEEKTITIESTGEEFTIKIKPISWSRRNKIMSESVEFNAGGEQTAFDGDRFMRALLREIIVEAPWGRTTETFLLSIDSRLGAALEQLVPNVVGAEENTDEIKKDA
tara:strand:- start:1901 stop:2281 length:381 start_codon:yes stop_codon:yes gene_type:complete